MAAAEKVGRATDSTWPLPAAEAPGTGSAGGTIPDAAAGEATEAAAMGGAARETGMPPPASGSAIESAIRPANAPMPGANGCLMELGKYPEGLSQNDGNVLFVFYAVRSVLGLEL